MHIRFCIFIWDVCMNCSWTHRSKHFPQRFRGFQIWTSKRRTFDPTFYAHIEIVVTLLVSVNRYLFAILGHNSAPWSRFVTILGHDFPTRPRKFLLTYRNSQIMCQTRALRDQHVENKVCFVCILAILAFELFGFTSKIPDQNRPLWFELEVRFQVFGVHP